MRKSWLLLLFIPITSLAQFRGSNWAISDSILLTFGQPNVNVGTSVLRETNAPRDQLEPMATISNDSGKLLFYTNGFTVWNRNNIVMQNGDSLECDFSSTNGVIIVPYPDNDSLYYIFYIKGDQAGLYYSVVNMNLDSGLGAIVEGRKNISLLTSVSLTEKLAAVKHGNGRDWWIIRNSISNSNYYKFLVSPDSIYGPFVQTIGRNQGIYARGQMEFSPQGNKLGTVNGIEAEIFDFDRCTGELSDEIVLDSVSGYYGSSFSSDGSKFYASDEEKLYQFNLSNPNPASTKTVIYKNPYLPNSNQDSTYAISQFELGPEGKIYIAFGYGVSWPDYKHYSFQDLNLSVINQPDSLGAKCNFQPFSLFLGGHRTTAGLPNMPNYNLGALYSAGTITLSKDTFCEDSKVNSTLSANGSVGSLQWQSSTDSTHFSDLPNDTLSTLPLNEILPQTTYYRLMAGSYPCVDSSNIVTIHIIPPPTANFTDSITGNEVFFSSKGSSKDVTAYSWDFGDSATSTLANPSHVYKTSKTYYVCLTVSNGSNCSYTSCKNIDYATGNASVIQPSLIQVYPNPVGNELTVESLNNTTPKQIAIEDALGRTLIQLAVYKISTQIDIRSLAVGVYFVKTQMNDGNVEVRKFVKE